MSFGCCKFELCWEQTWQGLCEGFSEFVWFGGSRGVPVDRRAGKRCCLLGSQGPLHGPALPAPRLSGSLCLSSLVTWGSWWAWGWGAAGHRAGCWGCWHWLLLRLRLLTPRLPFKKVTVPWELGGLTEEAGSSPRLVCRAWRQLPREGRVFRELVSTWGNSLQEGTKKNKTKNPKNSDFAL